jgi:hypothetical protein
MHSSQAGRRFPAETRLKVRFALIAFAIGPKELLAVLEKK